LRRSPRPDGPSLPNDTALSLRRSPRPDGLTDRPTLLPTLDAGDAPPTEGESPPDRYLFSDPGDASCVAFSAASTSRFSAGLPALSLGRGLFESREPLRLDARANCIAAASCTLICCCVAADVSAGASTDDIRSIFRRHSALPAGDLALTALPDGETDRPILL